MPTYEYECEKCGEAFEATQRITEPALETHDDCGGTVKRLISRSNFSLKGSGWYSDHYGLKSGGSEAKSDKSKDSSDSKPSSDTKSSDTKSSDTKSSDTKSSDTKSTDSKKSGGSKTSSGSD